MLKSNYISAFLRSQDQNQSFKNSISFTVYVTQVHKDIVSLLLKISLGLLSHKTPKFFNLPRRIFVIHTITSTKF